MTIFKLTNRPTQLGRGDMVAGRYVLEELLDEDTSTRQSMAWRAHDTRAGADVVIDLIASPAPQLSLAPLLAQLGLDTASIVGAGRAQSAGVRYFYLASRLPSASPVLASSEVA